MRFSTILTRDTLMADPSPWIFDVKADEFEQQVVQKSSEIPVIVDFWAPSCPSCQLLTPIIEQAVNDAAGKLLLAKVNVDDNPELAQMMGVQSIPVVVAFFEGQVIDHFQGVLPEDELKAWLARLVPSKAAELFKEALELLESDPATAEANLREVLELEPSDNIKIYLAQTLLAQNRDEECGQIIAELEVRGFLEPEAEKLKSQLELRANAEESGGVQQARAAAEANPEDLSLQISLAEALAVENKHRDAFEILLAVATQDRSGDDGDKARQQMVKMFDVLGAGSELVSEYRRKLATALY
jgi:putative thioredoxin